MNAVQLRQELILSISKIEDLEFLQAIKTIIDFKKKEVFLKLSSLEEQELLYASKEGKKGNVVSQSSMDKKVEEWLKEK